MTGIETAVQTGLRGLLIASADVTDLVPADSILDRHQRPNPSPVIVLGEALADWSDTDIARRKVRVFADIHIWVREQSTETAKRISGAVALVLAAGGTKARIDLGEDWHCGDVFLASARHLRDAGGELSHGILSVQVLAKRG
ncbi:MAG: hypothetical protein CME90_05920 [Hoeflea sp.]|nr:hypothetical protein [Hoeflea sp.]|tara:strand:+ start:5012 stop:5437 length:426 start_codon:yes stop_codon:yes gene_type:complete